MKVVLELQEQLANVRRVTVRHDIVIGRGSDCNLRLSAPQMSRRHCFLRVGRDGVSVTDLDSSNGTYVDNKRITPGERVELKTGSILTLGPVNFIVHLKEDSGSTTKSEGERSRKSSKSTSGASESSTIVSSAAAIIAEEFKSKPPLDYSVEQAGAAAEAHEETARIKKNRVSETVAKRTSSTPASSPAQAEIPEVATPAVTKATAATAAIGAAVVAPIAESIVKAESVNTSPPVESVVDSIDNDDSQSAASESSWLTDDSPDDLSFFGGQQSDDSLAPPDDVSGSAAAADDVVEEVVEVLDDDDIFAGEVVNAAVAEELVEAVEVLEDEPVEVLDELPVEAVELLHDETPANALTADFEEADLPGNLFSEVLEEPEVLAEEVVEAELVEVIEEPAEFVQLLDDDEPIEVMEAVSVEPEPSEAELVEVLEEPEALAEEVAEAELIEEVEEPVEVAQVLDETAAVDVLEEPSDFFAMLGIDVDEPQQVIEPVAGVEDAAAVSDAGAEQVSPEIDWFSDAVEEVVDVAEEPPAEAIVDEVQLFDDIDLITESSVSDENLAAEAPVPEASALEEATLEPSDSVSSESPWDDVVLSEVASPALDGEFDFLNEEPQAFAVGNAAETEDPATATVDTTLQNENIEEFAEIEAEAEVDAEIEAANDADVEAVEEFDFFDDIEAVEPIAAIEPTVEQIDAVEEFDAEVEEIELFEEIAEADVVADSEAATSSFAEVSDDSEAPMEEFAVVEEADAVEEAWDFSEIAAEDVVTEYQESPEVVAPAADEVIEEEVSAEEDIIEEEVLEVAEEDEASNWFDIGDNKVEDDDDRELREFLKGF